MFMKISSHKADNKHFFHLKNEESAYLGVFNEQLCE